MAVAKAEKTGQGLEEVDIEWKDPTWIIKAWKMKRHDTMLLKLPTKSLSEITATLASHLQL